MDGDGCSQHTGGEEDDHEEDHDHENVDVDADKAENDGDADNDSDGDDDDDDVGDDDDDDDNDVDDDDGLPLASSPTALPQQPWPLDPCYDHTGATDSAVHMTQALCTGSSSIQGCNTDACTSVLQVA